MFSGLMHVQKDDYHKPHSLDYKCGHPIKKLQQFGIGNEPLEANAGLFNQSAEKLLESLGNDPKLTYGDKQFHTAALPPRFVPAYVALDKVVCNAIHCKLGFAIQCVLQGDRSREQRAVPLETCKDSLFSRG